MPRREGRKRASFITAGAPTIQKSSSGCAGWPRASCADARRKRSSAPAATGAGLRLPYGDLYVLEAIWKQLGIDAIVRQQAGTRHLGFDVERARPGLIELRLAPGRCSTAMRSGSRKMRISTGRRG